MRRCSLLREICSNSTSWIFTAASARRAGKPLADKQRHTKAHRMASRRRTDSVMRRSIFGVNDSDGSSSVCAQTCSGTESKQSHAVAREAHAIRLVLSKHCQQHRKGFISI
eukprot:1424118-Pleurochrysis_carterae.AAC.2